MRTLFLFFSLFSLSIVSLLSADCQVTSEVEVGYRRDNLCWKRTDIIHVHDISSEARFRDIDSFVLTGKARAVDTCYYFRTYADFGWLTNGNFRHFATFTPREGHENLQQFRANIRRHFSDDYVLDASAALGYPFAWGPDYFMFAPLIGYSYHAQCFQIKHKRFLIDLLTQEQQDQVSMHKNARRVSSFQFRWYAPFIGFDLALALEDSWSVYGEFEYHFSGRNQTKTRTNFGVKKFDEIDTIDCAYGFSYVVGTNYFFCGNWYSSLVVNYRYWKAKQDRRSRSCSNDQVTWTNWGISAALGYVF